MAKVSVIVPIYNVEKYISECIESIQKQSLKDIEIILVDDGSKDKSVEIADDYAAKDNRIKVIHKENGGVTSARKAGLQIVQSPYVCFIDSDDYIHKKMCEQLYNSAIQHNVETVLNQTIYRIFDNKCEIWKGKLKSGLYSEDDNSIKYIKDNIWNYKERCGVLPFLWCNLYQTECAKMILEQVPNDIVFSEDGTFIYMLLAISKHIYIMNEPYYYYRMREGSAVDSIDRTLLLNIAKRYLTTCDFFERNQISATIFKQLKYNIFEEILTHFFKKEGMSSFLFPYEKVKKGENIILYAAGSVGKSYYRQIVENNYCNIVLWVDTNYLEIKKENRIIESPEQIRNVEYEKILIAVLNESVGLGIKQKLIAEYKIDSNKIITHVPKSFFDLLD